MYALAVSFSILHLSFSIPPFSQSSCLQYRPCAGPPGLNAFPLRPTPLLATPYAPTSYAFCPTPYALRPTSSALR